MHGIIGVDVGTTHIKSILFAGDGRVLGEEKTPTPLHRDASGSWYEPLEIWRLVSEQLASHRQAFDGELDAISVTGMAEAGLIVNRKTNREQTRILPWFETCTQPLAAGMDAATERERFRVTGLHNSFKYGIYKFQWLLAQSKTDRQEAVWLSMCDYIVWKLTGELVTDPSFAARTYAYDIRKNCWDREWLAELGLSEENFPRVLPSGQTAGFWRAGEGPAEPAIPSEPAVPVALAGHDHVCAAFALLKERPEAICDSAGTSETYVGRVKQVPEGGFDPDTGVLYGPFVDGGWFFMASVPSSGHSVEWFRKRLQLSELSYEELNRRAMQEQAGPTGLLYFPYLTGMGSPWYEAGMRGALIGFGENDGGMKLFCAVMEGIQYQAAWILQRLDSACDTKGKELVCAGGAVHNRAMMRIKADVLNRCVRTPQEGEATLVGAAALFYRKKEGDKAAAVFLKNALPEGDSYLPDPERAAAYEEIWKKRFLPMAELLRKYYDTRVKRS
ncbi:MAG: FGGY family carbohydrate kinase [Eubacteriales bacterium]|nr:FGGY family carbohydrate kinase [Eubacteriales bacterium]